MGKPDEMLRETLKPVRAVLKLRRAIRSVSLEGSRLMRVACYTPCDRIAYRLYAGDRENNFADLKVFGGD